MNKPQLPKSFSSILSRQFRYVPAAQTDIAKTFARVRHELEREARPSGNVSLLTARKTRSGP